MKDLSTMLRVLHQEGGLFTDISEKLGDFSADSVAVTLSTTGFVYLGYHKPFTSVYLSLATASTGSRSVEVEAFDGTSWGYCRKADDTTGLARSGNVQWDPPSTNAEASVNSETLFWVRLSVGVSTSAMSLKAISQLFSDDRDLLTLNPRILDADFLLGQTSHELHHVSARDEIVQAFRNKGRRGKGSSDVWGNLTFWDLYDVQEVRLAAAHLAASKVFMTVANSGQSDDRWLAKARFHKGEYEKAVKLAYASFADSVSGNDKPQAMVGPNFLRRG